MRGGAHSAGGGCRPRGHITMVVGPGSENTCSVKTVVCFRSQHVCHVNLAENKPPCVLTLLTEVRGSVRVGLNSE